jgi:hypothetical protein
MRNRWSGSGRRRFWETQEGTESPEREEAKKPPIERSSGRERRHDSRIRLSLEVAVPVVVRSEGFVEAGLARNISEGGMLVQLRELPAIGSRVEITIGGVQGSSDAPESVTLEGEVRHHVAWQYRTKGQVKLMRGVGVRFLEISKETDALPGWVWSVGQTIH